MPDSDAGLSEEQIFARCSSHSWHRLHRETDCPQDQIASAEILKGWLRPGTPGAGEAIQAANKLLNALNMKPHPNALAVARVFDLKITGHYWFFKEKDRLIATPFMELPDGKMSSDTGEGWTVEAVHRHWKIHNNNPDEFPLMPLVSAWHQRPEHLPVPDYTDNARVVGMTQARATSAQLTESREARIAAMELCTSTRGTLPLFQSTNLHAPPDPRLSVPLIDLWDLHRFPILSRGRRASLEAIFIVKFTAVMMAARNRDENKPVAMTLEELILLLWPKDGNLRLKQRWPRIREMLMRLQTTVLRFADGTAWPFVTLMGTAIPEIWTDGTPDKEAIAVFRVSWPPGTGAGAQIPWRTLDDLAEGRPGEFRAGIAALSLAFDPGKTRVKIGKQRWRWSANPLDYRTYTTQQRRELSFGDQKTHHYSDAKVNDMWRRLARHGFTVVEDALHPGFRDPNDPAESGAARAAHTAIQDRVVDPRTGEIRWIVMPLKPFKIDK